MSDNLTAETTPRSRRNGKDRQTSDAAKYRRRLRASEALRAQQEQVLNEMRVAAIKEYVRGKLLRWEDFPTLIGFDRVIDTTGRIDYNELDLRLADLFRRRPELAAPNPEDSRFPSVK